MSASKFTATRWTLVIQARGSDTAAAAALSELCAGYYEPVVAFLRASGRTEDTARELAHGFFAGILGGKSLAGADAARGRFRSYLLGAVKHFAADQKDHACAQKRGEGREPASLDAPIGDDEGSCVEVPAPTNAALEHTFDRTWALTVIARALEVVGGEWRVAEKAEQFEAFKPWLSGSVEATLTQADAAQALGMSEGAVKVAIHRLRHRFREAVRAEVAQTLPMDSDVDDELRHLVAVLISG